MEFDLLIAREQRPCLIYFRTPSCSGCRRFDPVFERLARDYEGRIRFVRADLMQIDDLATVYDLVVVPTLVLTQAGSEIERVAGRPRAEYLRAALDRAAGGRR